MELKLNREEVEIIILAWAEKEMSGKFNTVNFKTYENEVELLYVEPTIPEDKLE